ncbi:MAG: hypothetical protein KatS3mg024_0237 [Armatimonadota bacterium]|nr:MAG: hypothetical protein KatS3mg024_0237 [Armatimonadota bacterium]
MERKHLVIKVAMSFAAAIAACVVGTSPTSALTWTPPLIISPASDTGCSVPSIASAPDGRIFVVYRRKNPDWRLLYRERSATGVWGPVETVSVPWSERANIAYHPDGSIWVVYAGSPPGGATDLFLARRVSGTWSTVQLTNTPGVNEDYAMMRVMGDGRVHLVYAVDKSIQYRMWNGSSWTAPVALGNCEREFYHRPGIAVDAAGRVHVIWEESKRILYRRLEGSTWTSTQVIGTTTGFFAYGRIATSGSNGVVVVTFDQVNDSTYQIKHCSSSDGGQTWTPISTLVSAGHYPWLAQGADGVVHLVYHERPSQRAILYRRWSGGTWSAPETAASAADNVWKGWPCIVAGPDSTVHLVYDHAETIAYVSGSSVVTPLPPVTNLRADVGDRAVRLTWTNPADSRVVAAVVNVKSGSFPTSPTDGTRVAEVAASPGAQSSYLHLVASNTTQYYSVFAKASDGSFSGGVSVQATPRPQRCTDVRMLPNGTWTMLRGKVVSGIFSSDGCIYVQEEDRAGGLRVAGTFPPLSVGSRVDISGTMETVLVGGIPSERQLRLDTITLTGSGPSPVPLHMRTSTVGGAAVPPYIPGVRDGKGVNSMGLLVRVSGRVTAVVGQYFYVDDGEAVPDISGRVGVMVRWPFGTPTVSAGQMVTVSGVVTGSIPTGWSTNRRLLFMRSAQDLIIH